MKLAHSLFLVASLATIPAGCGTILGTAVSPITGGVDLVKVSLRPSQWYFALPVFIGGAISGPFVAFYNGVNYDAEIFDTPFNTYWHNFGTLFRPFEKIGL